MWPILKALKLTEEEYRAIVERANGQCEICKEELTRPHVDHCHKTGKVRGVLCSRCNTGLGMFRESLDIFLMAITYLEKRA